MPPRRPQRRSSLDRLAGPVVGLVRATANWIPPAMKRAGLRRSQGEAAVRSGSLAERQTAGPWPARPCLGDPGGSNLAATLLLRPQASPPDPDSVVLRRRACGGRNGGPFRAAGRHHRQMAQRCSGRWPKSSPASCWNPGRMRRTWLAVGIGINLAQFPDGTEFPATAIGDAGRCAAIAGCRLAPSSAGRFAHW